MAKILVLSWRRIGRLFAENKLRFCSTCLSLLTITALIQCFASFLYGDVERFENARQNLLRQIYSNFSGTTSDTFPFVIEANLANTEGKFANEESRILGLPMSSKMFQSRKRKARKIIYLATEYFGEWNPGHYYFPHLGSKTFSRYPCPFNECFVTKDSKRVREADAVLFHVRDLVVYKFPSFRSGKQVWILYSMEPAWLELLDMRRFNGMFNWTMSYRNGSDIIVKYGLLGRRPVPSPNKMSLISEKCFWRKEDRAVWYVSNCCTDSRREKYVAELIKHFPVDVLGGCGNEGCRPAESSSCYQKIEKRYKFYLAFENAICRDYVTEKLYNALEYKIIPVVFGGADYRSLVPENSVINALEFKDPEELADHLWLVARNITLYRSYFRWKETYRAYLYPWMCDLCEKLHSENISAPVRHDLVTWWHESYSCKRWTENRMEKLDPNTYAIPCYHTRLFQ